MVLFGENRRNDVKSIGGGIESDQVHEGCKEIKKAETRSGLDFPILDLDANVIHEILSRLPIRSILACRCVCKTFFELLKVDHPYFAQLHLTRAPATASLVFQRISRGRTGLDFCMFDLDQGFSSASPCSIDCQHGTCRNHLNPARAKQNTTSWFLDRIVTVVGECNGLLCLCLYSNLPLLPLYVICNPFLGEYVSLPYRPVTTPAYSLSIRSGFGYSPKSGHYKVIHFARLTSSDHLTSVVPTSEIVVEIHTLGSDSWRRIHGIPCPKIRGSFDPMLNGSLHWLTESHKPAELLCSLDLESECFTFLQPPAHLSMDCIKKISWMNVGVFQESLCLCYVYESSQFEVWVMKDYGVGDSWTKEFTIDINFYTGLRDVDFHQPLKFMNSGELWLHCSLNRLVSYSPQTRAFKDLDFLGQFPTQVILYYPSFISLQHAVEGKNLTVVKIGKDRPAVISLF